MYNIYIGNTYRTGASEEDTRAEPCTRRSWETANNGGGGGGVVVGKRKSRGRTKTRGLETIIPVVFLDLFLGGRDRLLLFYAVVVVGAVGLLLLLLLLFLRLFVRHDRCSVRKNTTLTV